MSRMRQLFFWLAAAGAVFTVSAQQPPALAPRKFPPATNFIPPVPMLQSPVNFFRQLLVMTPVERNHALTNRPPEARAKILAKVREYQALGPDERELRLRATELRWYLTPLLALPPAQCEARLKLVPEDMRGLLQSRLAQWDALPPATQQEFLANEKTLRYFTRVEATNAPTPGAEQQKIAEQFNRFLELTPTEKQQTLNTLSAAERAAMEKTLQTFSRLTEQQRELCVRNYAKFAGMGAAEQAQFLENAAQWARMSPKERQAWRDLVKQIPAWPPLPVLPPHHTPKYSGSAVATNLN
jgi:Protein of unknown function (DUF3106)